MADKSKDMATDAVTRIEEITEPYRMSYQTTPKTGSEFLLRDWCVV